MKNWRIFLARLCMVAVVLSAAGASCGWAQGMMGGEGMREMMQNMMGDMLPPMNAAQLPDPDSKGALLLQQFCTQCHNLPGPGLHTAAQWPPVVNRMVIRMQRMSGHGMMMMGRIEAPDKQELATILGYLQTHAQKPLGTRLAPGLETAAGKAFRDFCSQCHALPDPGQHTANKWPGVVERMKGYMESMGKEVPDEKTLREILGFLQRNAQGGK
jgi:cytochrome c2